MTSDASDQPSRKGFGAVDAGASDEDAGIDRPVQGAPSDNTTLVSVLASFEAQGFTAQFIPGPGGTIECAGCGDSIPATEFIVEATRRLEGASDPDDMMTVVAARCPRCGVAGTLVLGYGPNASENDAAISAVFGRTTPAAQGAEVLDPDAPGASLFRNGDAVEPNEPA